MGKSEIRVGIIGLGWGAAVHAPAYMRSDGYRLAGLCARDPNRLATLSHSLGVATIETDWRTFVRRDDLDLISIASPVPLHAEMAIAAAEAGKHIYLEKPVAPSLAQAEAVLEAVARAGVQHAMGFEFRWQPDRECVSRLIQDLLPGRPYLFRLTQSWGWNHPALVKRPAAGSAALDKLRRERGGGFLNGMVSHDIDYVRSLFGDPVAVMALAGMSRPIILDDGSVIDSSSDDVIALVMRFGDGPTAIVNASVVAAHQRECRIEVHSESGSILAVATDGTAFDVQAGESGEQELRKIPIDPNLIGTEVASSVDVKIGAQRRLLEAWRPAFDGQPTAAPVPDLTDGLAVQRIIDAAFRSSDGAGWVELSSSPRT